MMRCCVSAFGHEGLRPILAVLDVRDYLDIVKFSHTLFALPFALLGAALAVRRGKGFVLVRKQGKLPPPVVDVAYDLEYGSGVLEMQRGNGRVVLVDDVLATGGTMTAAADLCERAGYQLKALVALIDLKIIQDYSWRNLRLRASIEY